MRRREFGTLLAGAAVTLRSAQSYAQPQPSKIYRMGYLAAARIPLLIEALKRVFENLATSDQDSQDEYRFAQGGTATLDVLAAELVRLGPDVIVILGTPAVIAVKQATKTIPIVMAGVGDPLGSGIVTSLAHPDGNVTGVALYGAELAGKRVAVFKEAVPSLGSLRGARQCDKSPQY